MDELSSDLGEGETQKKDEELEKLEKEGLDGLSDDEENKTKSNEKVFKKFHIKFFY